MPQPSDVTLSTLEYHVLLALAGGPMHGYAIRDAVEQESEGALRPRAGTLYRVIARLISDGFALETDGAADAGPHPGRARRYYTLSVEGRATLAQEARRLHGAAALAEKRLGVSRP
jgi:DNA-binding PadR family transcriptional regulator